MLMRRRSRRFAGAREWCAPGRSSGGTRRRRARRAPTNPRGARKRARRRYERRRISGRRHRHGSGFRPDRFGQVSGRGHGPCVVQRRHHRRSSRRHAVGKRLQEEIARDHRRRVRRREPAGRVHSIFQVRPGRDQIGDEAIAAVSGAHQRDRRFLCQERRCRIAQHRGDVRAVGAEMPDERAASADQGAPALGRALGAIASRNARGNRERHEPAAGPFRGMRNEMASPGVGRHIRRVTGLEEDARHPSLDERERSLMQWFPAVSRNTVRETSHARRCGAATDPAATGTRARSHP